MSVHQYLTEDAGAQPIEFVGAIDSSIARILVVDDDANNLKSISSILEGLADEVVLANSGQEALRHILQLDFALILLDIIMPGFDGYETAELIRNRKRSSRIPIIFLTAADRDDVQMFRGYSAGAVDFVFKPIEPLVLRSKVAAFVDLHRKTQEILRKSEDEKRLLLEYARANDEKLRVERELRRSEERLALITRSLPIAFYTIDVPGGGGKRQFVGAGRAALSRLPIGESMGKSVPWIDWIHPDDRERVKSAFSRLAETGVVDIDYRICCIDGSYRAVLDQAVLTSNEGGEREEIVGFLLDVTERVSVQEQLMQAQKMDAVGRLTGGIAHDFNNMLTVVVASLDRLRRKLHGNPEALRPADMAMQGALRCADLTRRLLAFSRKQPFVREPVDLNKIVLSVEEMLRRLIGDNIRLELDCSPDLWMTETDPAQIESAIINLAINARDAMPNGGRLKIATANVRETGKRPSGLADDFVAVTVADTGHGIAPEVLKRIFEPFFTTKNAGQGTGLGLSIIYNYIQDAGGNIDVCSEVGRGTQVRLILPRATSFSGDRSKQNHIGQLRRGNGELVMVVEDDEVVRGQASIALLDFGYRVVEAENAKEALELLAIRSGVALLFTDVAMPGSLNGFELADEAMKQYPGLKVLFASGNPDFASGRKSTLVSESLMLRKPYRDYELAEAVRRAISDGS